MLPLDIDGLNNQVENYQFAPEHLATSIREKGISAFMRIRNGADFLETTIRSHIEFFDEIVAVYNQCTDDTEKILLRLQSEYGSDRLRVIHYLDRVYPQGTEGHARTKGDSKHSVVNYSNFALAATRFQTVTKLDDDHLAILNSLKEVCAQIRSGRYDSPVMRCFSGLNLYRCRNGTLAIPKHDPLSGSGDIGFFPINPKTYFYHDRRFERFHRGPIPREFVGFLYWHLKFLKGGLGFGNYELAENPRSRFMKKRAAIVDREPEALHIGQVAWESRCGLWTRTLSRVSEKIRLSVNRSDALATAFQEDEVESAIRSTVCPRILQHPSSAGLWERIPAARQAG
jgi:hypothetical protein